MEKSAEDSLYQAVLVEDEDTISQLLSQGKIQLYDAHVLVLK